MNKEFKPGEYWEERLAKNPDISGVGITIFGKAFNRWSYRSRRDSFRTMLKGIKAGMDISKMKVGDIGSGTGFYIDEWKLAGARNIAGFDITQTAVGLLKKKYPNDTFYHQDISQNLPSDLEGTFDIISCMDVFFHIVDEDNYQNAFNNISRMLKPGGILVYSENWVPKEEQSNGYWFVMKTPEEGLAVLKKAGLKLNRRIPFMQLMDAPRKSKSQIIQFYWKVLIWILRRMPQLGGFFGAAIYPFELASKSFQKSMGVELFEVRK